MNGPATGDAGPSGAAPPTVRGEVGRATPATAWPSMLGVPSLILGVVELGAAGWATFGWAMALRDMIVWDGDTSNRSFYLVAMGFSLAGLVVGVAAVVGSLALVGRRRRGVALMRWWVPFQMFVGAGAMILFWWAWGPFDMGSSGDPWELAFLYGWVGLTGAWLLGWPTCMILWLARRRVRDEIQRWR